jgi:ribonuclease inhibitor
MKNIIIDGDKIQNSRDIHAQLAKELDFGRFYGYNFDALWDMLSTNVERPFTITWKKTTKSKYILGADFETFLSLFKRLEDFDNKAPWSDKFKFYIEE